jgi:hypothetical protein
MENPMFRGMVLEMFPKNQPNQYCIWKNDEDLLADVKYLEN